MSWLERVDEFLHIGDAHSANYAAREATTLTPQNDVAWARRAQTSLLLGNDRDAIFELNEALRINPTEPGHHFDLGTIYESAGQWRDALSAFEHASELVPAEAMFRVAQASVHIQMDNPGRALQLMEVVLKEVPDNILYNNYMAMALHDSAVNRWTRIRPGGYLITKEEQIAPTKRNCEKGLKLKIDPDLRKGLTDLKAAAEKAEKMKFRLPGRAALGMGVDMGGAGGFLFGLLFGYGAWIIGPTILWFVHPLLGIIGFAAAGAYLYKFAYRPEWYWDDKDSRDVQIR